MGILIYTVSEPDAGKCVKTILTERLEISHGLLSRLKRRESGISVNGQKVYSTYVLRAGDVITIDVSDREPPHRLEPVKMDLDIVYEDEHMLVLNKPANVAVHPTKDPAEKNLEQGLLAYLGAGVFPHFVSRLDKGTTGLMLVAKSGYVHELMKRRLHTEDFFREYLAIADGIVMPPAGIVAAPIGLAEGSSYRHCVRQDGAESLTEYETLSTAHGRTLLRLLPKTGRTHQLRVHMAYLGHPLTGDWLYGTRSKEIDRPALHSRGLIFAHPMTGDRIELRSPMPSDMERLLS